MNLRDIQNPRRVDSHRIEGTIVSPIGVVYPISVGLQVTSTTREVKVAVTIKPITVFYQWPGMIKDEYSELVNRAIDLRPPVPVYVSCVS